MRQKACKKERSIPSALGKTIVVALFAILATLAGGCAEEQASDPPADEAAEQGGAEQKDAQPTATEATQATDGSVASVGEIVSLGDVRWQVDEVRQLNELYYPRFGLRQGNFIITEITFQNNSNQDITFATPFMTLVDSQGREYEPDIENNFTYVEPELNMFVDQIEPGATKEGAVIFSVEPDASGFRLRVGEARFSSDETADIDLGI